MWYIFKDMKVVYAFQMYACTWDCNLAGKKQQQQQTHIAKIEMFRKTCQKYKLYKCKQLNIDSEYS